jgi:pimeloyl-ACP methyl ester carboxylesterase
VGSGTFDVASRSVFEAAKRARTTPGLRVAMEAAAGVSDDERLARMAALLDSLYLVDPLPGENPAEPVDARANRETWDDMLRLQAAGTYPAELSAVRCPILMLHGEEDPHPGRAIRDSLMPFIRHLSYVEFPRCGHEPWRERAAREPFFSTLRTWLFGVL